jgi:isoleucyl-tRNA synthetase
MFLVNSPIVRGDNLRFREEGVREVISRVLLPWLNSFRFFLGQVALMKKAAGHEFRYDAHAPVSNNVMDRWILARCQSLIKLVKEEMAAYRLYTIIPRLLDLIDELTNWYIRFNRRRLKGEDGLEDTVVALNTLFETLFTLCRTMVSKHLWLAYFRLSESRESHPIPLSSQKISTSPCGHIYLRIQAQAIHGRCISCSSQTLRRNISTLLLNVK